MVYVLIRHKVEDYSKWRSEFDNFLENRKSAGELSFKVFQNSENPSEVTALFEWESLEKAKQFLESSELKDKMQEAGVAEQPDIYYLNEAN